MSFFILHHFCISHDVMTDWFQTPGVQTPSPRGEQRDASSCGPGGVHSEPSLRAQVTSITLSQQVSLDISTDTCCIVGLFSCLCVSLCVSLQVVENSLSYLSSDFFLGKVCFVVTDGRCSATYSLAPTWEQNNYSIFYWSFSPLNYLG